LALFHLWDTRAVVTMVAPLALEASNGILPPAFRSGYRLVIIVACPDSRHFPDFRALVNHSE
jgi:hypothetical protein